MKGKQLTRVAIEITWIAIPVTSGEIFENPVHLLGLRLEIQFGTQTSTNELIK
jgi:hypothetical protein